MAQPVAYVPDYDFSDFQTEHPATPLPGGELDNELNNIKRTTDQVRANLALIQRDDGALADGVVTIQTLDPVVRALLAASGGVFRGDWATATAYNPKDLVVHSGKTYLCTIAHTSGTFATDLAAGKWLEMLSVATVPVIRLSDYGAVADGLDDTPTDNTSAFTAAMTAASENGAAIQFDAGLYRANITVTKDNLIFLGQSTGRDNDVLDGLAPFDLDQPALSIGDGISLVSGFEAHNLRVYDPASTVTPVQINGAAFINWFGGSIGAGEDGAVSFSSSDDAAGCFYIDFWGTTFFSSSGVTAGDVVSTAISGDGFVQAVSLHGGRIVANNAASGAHALRIGAGTTIRTPGTWIEATNLKGVIHEANSLWLGDEATQVDSGNSSDVLVEIPGSEVSINSFVRGGIRFDGQAKNGAAVVFDLKGVDGSGQGQSYGEVMFKPTAVGYIEFRGTDVANVAGPRVLSTGGGPEGSVDAPLGSLFMSKNSTGSGNVLFAKAFANIGGDVTKGWLRVPLGDYYNQAAPANLNSAATCNIYDAAGDMVYIDGTVDITSFGTPTNVDSGRKRWCQANGAFKVVHDGTTNFLVGQADITMVSGDRFLMEYQGSGHSRMIDFVPFSTRLYHPSAGWATWTGTPNLASKATSAATLAEVAGTVMSIIQVLFDHKMIKV